MTCKNKYFEEKLGQVLSAKDLSQYLGLDEATIRKYYQELGGKRIGTKYLFFEKEVQRAVQERKKMDWSDTEEWNESAEEVSNQTGGLDLGVRPEKGSRRKLEDNFGIFPRRVGEQVPGICDSKSLN